MTYYSTAQLAAASGLKPRTIRRHVANGWLKPVPKTEIPGVRGSRFKELTAKKWLAIHKPEKTLP